LYTAPERRPFSAGTDPLSAFEHMIESLGGQWFSTSNVLDLKLGMTLM